MREQGFITPHLSLQLDLVRGLAALAVLVGHARQMGLYTGAYPFSIALQKDAVIVFFVLSGLVIAASVQRPQASLRRYVIARAARILPVAIPGLLVSVGVAAAFTAMPPGTASQVLLSAVFLSESLGNGLAINAPFWSLCYEVWFYAIFAAAIFLTGRARLAAVAALCLLAGPNILLLMPAWLVGVALAFSPRARQPLRPATARLCVTVMGAGLIALPALAPAMMKILAAVTFWDLRNSHYAITDTLMAMAIGLGFMGLRAMPGLGKSLEPCAVPVRALAGMSFSLYLLHWPVLVALKALGVTAGGNAIAFMALLVAIVALCWLFSAMTERRAPVLRAVLDRAFPPTAAVPARPMSA